MSLNFNEEYYTTKEEGITNYHNFPHFAARATWIKNNLTGSILEIGCAFGFLIQELDSLGVDASGIDSSEYAVSNVSSNITNKVYLLSTKDINQEYDWIISWNVLDCLKDEADASQVAQVLNTYAQNQLHIIQTDREEDYTKQGYFIRSYDYWRTLLPTATIVEQTGKVHGSFSKVPLSFGGVSE